MNSPEPKKELGQHWLHDRKVLSAIGDDAALKSNETVLEIGPGLGTLTEILLERGAHVIALEYDRVLAIQLERTLSQKGVATSSLNVVEGDIRTYNFSDLPAGYKIIANIPYYLTSYLIRLLSDTQNRPSKAALLMQKEVAHRIAAESKRGLISVTTQLWFDTELGTEVDRELFAPPPKVDSQVLILTSRSEPRISGDTSLFIRLAKAGFSEKRKNLRNALSGGLAIDKEVIGRVLDEAQLSHDLRAEDMSWQQWQVLFDAWQVQRLRNAGN